MSGQSKISLFTSQFSYIHLYFSQQRLICSLYSRLMSVRDTLLSTRFSFFSNKFTSEEKLRISLNLKFGNLYSYPDFYYTRKKTEFIKLTQTFNIYCFSFSCLLNLSLLPFVDIKSDKFTFLFRPYYCFDDFFIYIKNLFLKSNSSFCFMKISFSSSFSFSSNGKFTKNLPFLNKCIEVYLKNSNFFTSYDQKSLLFFKKNIRYTIFNYLFFGLL